MESETIQDRAERAQSQSMDVTLVDTEPVVVQVYNEESDRIHTVIPESVHCSCEDHTYRDIICKHILVLLQADGHIGDVMRESIKEKKDAISKEISDLVDQKDQLQAQVRQITDALNAVDANHNMARTGAEVLDEVREEDVNTDPLGSLVEELSESGGAE